MEGLTLPDGWIVGEQIGPGGSRSVGYEVTGPNGESAFLKALDLFRAFEAEDTLAAMDEITSSIRHERDLIDLCAEQRMSRVVRGIAHGVVKLEDDDFGVWYLIFERAEGDMRHEVSKPREDPEIWRRRTLHEAAVGLSQMHRVGLCHQNIKPAHLLAFGALGVKLADLSTTSYNGASAPMFDSELPGELPYAPPECLYRFRPGDELEAHRARDMYLLGSLILFVYAEVTTTTALITHLPADWHPSRADASFLDALPYLEEAFDLVVEKELLDSDCPELLIQSFREMCAPDPRRRGHPRTRAERHGSPYSLERYVSRFALALSQASSVGPDERQAA
jgi:serine/threonine protein kinase